MRGLRLLDLGLGVGEWALRREDHHLVAGLQRQLGTVVESLGSY